MMKKNSKMLFLYLVSGWNVNPSKYHVKRDKDGTYTKSIMKRFDQGADQGVNGSGIFDEDGWIYIISGADICNKCGEVFYTLHGANDVNYGMEMEEKHSNCPTFTGTICQIVFDAKTGKVVDGSDFVLKDYPIGTFFMDVDHYNCRIMAGVL